MSISQRAFLTAEWRYLAMFNFAVEPSLLERYVPVGTQLDSWRGTTYVSVVGFLFQNTRLLGLPIPGHRTFEELNLRFYVKREDAGEVRRGVTFIKEIVPRAAIAGIARLVYNEPYQALRMQHRIEFASDDRDRPGHVEYAWRIGERWNQIAVRPTTAPHAILGGSEEEFITEHYWGYTRQRDGGTIEYRVQHPRWRVWPISDYVIDADLEALYGRTLGETLRARPTSVLLADGSPVAVYQPRRLNVDVGTRG